MRGVSTTDEGESRSVVPLVEVEGNVVDYVDAITASSRSVILSVILALNCTPARSPHNFKLCLENLMNRTTTKPKPIEREHRICSLSS